MELDETYWNVFLVWLVILDSQMGEIENLK
mgnify:CR=1 FL=1